MTTMVLIGFIILAILGLCAVVTTLGLISLNRTYRPAGRFVPVTGGRLHVVEIGPLSDVRR